MGAQVKNATTLNEQITLLRNRGMAVDDRLARQWLSNISYYRLSGYSYPYRVLQPTDDPKKPVREDDLFKVLPLKKLLSYTNSTGNYVP